MDSSFAIWLIAGISLIAGIAIGYFGARFYPTAAKQDKLATELENLRKQQREYENHVSEHFSTTAQLLGNLTLAYRDFHNHVAVGAENLARDSHATLIKPLPELPEDLVSPKTAISQPLDYSPERNVLDEAYNINKDYPISEPPRY